MRKNETHSHWSCGLIINVYHLHFITSTMHNGLCRLLHLCMLYHKAIRLDIRLSSHSWIFALEDSNTFMQFAIPLSVLFVFIAITNEQQFYDAETGNDKNKEKKEKKQILNFELKRRRRKNPLLVVIICFFYLSFVLVSRFYFAFILVHVSVRLWESFILTSASLRCCFFLSLKHKNLSCFIACVRTFVEDDVHRWLFSTMK